MFKKNEYRTKIQTKNLRNQRQKKIASFVGNTEYYDMYDVCGISKKHVFCNKYMIKACQSVTSLKWDEWDTPHQNNVKLRKV